MASRPRLFSLPAAFLALASLVLVSSAFAPADGASMAAGTSAHRTSAPWRWATLSAGYTHTCGVRQDDSAWCWGDNSAGDLGDGSTLEADTPVRVHTHSGWDWVSVTAGVEHSCGLRGDGTAWCWGDNFNGELGDGSLVTSYVPVRVRAEATG